MKRFDSSFSKLLDKPCWGVKRRPGSFLMLEFGTPHLEIHDRPAGLRVGRRRLAYVHGDWHLCLYCCDWSVFDAANRPVGDSSSRASIDRAVRYVNGQALKRAELKPRGMRTVLEFDLGARLETKPYNRTDEQWMLYEPSGKVLTVRADKRYSYQSGNCPPERMKWLAVNQP